MLLSLVRTDFCLWFLQCTLNWKSRTFTKGECLRGRQEAVALVVLRHLLQPLQVAFREQHVVPQDGKPLEGPVQDVLH